MDFTKSSNIRGDEKEMTEHKVVVVASGGLDSVSYMGVMLKEGWKVEAISFDYGQKATREMEVLKEICDVLKVPVKIIDMKFMRELWKGTQLTDSDVKVEDGYVPSVVVPLRNAVMLSIAYSYAATIGAEVVGYGSHLGDIGKFDHKVDGVDPHKEFYYPDCSPQFARALQEGFHKGMFECEAKPIIDAPAMHGWTKSILMKKGKEKLGDLIYKTWSCYKSEGKQCGVCESCVNRKNSFKSAEIEDKTEYLQ